MVFWIAIAAALGCAVCNGLAAVLQKISADRQEGVNSLSLHFIWRLLHDRPYLIGSLFDATAWVLTLIAVHALPLFVVQPITALSVVVTAVIERIYFRRRLNNKTYFAISLTLLGLLLLASSASAETAVPVVGVARWGIIFAPLALAAVGMVFAKRNTHTATIVLAAISGIGFGGTAIEGRMLNFSAPFWHVLVDPVFISLLAYGLVGIMTFTMALQRHHASVVNAAMVAFETIVPALTGILFLGDRPRDGMWAAIVCGIGLAVVGTTIIAMTDKKTKRSSSAEESSPSLSLAE
jgi:drug/metabolite transporter (DMT)-like permease